MFIEHRGLKITARVTKTVTTMPLTPLIQRKLDEYYQHCLVALDFLFKNDAEHALGDFRKSAEAFMKILILKKFGEGDGERMILGEIDHEFKPILPAKRLEFQDFLDILKVEKLTNGITFPRLIDLQKRTNPSVHNPNQPTNFEADLNLCKAQSFEITKVLYQELTASVPSELEKAYQGIISSALIAALQSSPWENLLSFAEGFSRHQKYMLVSPPKFESAALANLSVLSRIDWSFVLDFDPLSKESGLYKAFDMMAANSFVPLTIKQRGQRNLVGAGSYSNINWLFANGLNSIPDTTAANIRSWRSQKYHTFLKDLFADFFSKEVSRYTVIYLWDDIDFVEEVTRAIAELDEAPLDLVKHIFLSKNPNTINRLHGFDKYEIQFEVFDLSNEQFLNELITVLVKSNTEKPGVFVPARTKSDENAVLDISDIHQKLLDDNIIVIHEHIEQIEQSLAVDHVPPFYRASR